jgi:hypothetical protein
VNLRLRLAGEKITADNWESGVLRGSALVNAAEKERRTLGDLPQVLEWTISRMNSSATDYFFVTGFLRERERATLT